MWLCEHVNMHYVALGLALGVSVVGLCYGIEAC